MPTTENDEKINVSQAATARMAGNFKSSDQTVGWKQSETEKKEEKKLS